ncbi:hypothetical protein C2G38_2243340 [Gigaspora rosea]|uniref:Uncharacterized protein n=1 Tax=Gigaspora rosea TaxID=44941 RepID=A0A397VTJ6_9GLOM|nr:hypothetical protein C2G38_2243340 [Gigaspora rosea]
MDADLLHNKFKKQMDWKVQAECTIGNKETPMHQCLFGKLCKIDINNLTYDDSLSNSVIDLASDQFQLFENILIYLKRDEFQEIYKLVVVEYVNIVHYHWVEQESNREQIVRDITEYLMQLIKSNFFCQVFRDSENSLVEVVAQLIEVVT